MEELLYFDSTNGGAVYTKTCASDCFIAGTTVNGCFVSSSTSPAKRNDLLDISLIRCSPNIDNDRRGSAHLDSGNQTIKNINISSARNDYYSALHITTPVQISMNFNNVENNFPSGYTVIYIPPTTCIVNINTCNFINNTSTASTGILNVTPLGTIVENSVFYINSGCLFSGKLTSIKCFISHSGPVTIGADILLISSMEFVLTFNLLNFGTALCITPIPEPTTLPPTQIIGYDLTPCATLPPLPTPAQTIPLLPTECVIFSQENSNLSSISSFIVSILRFTIILINI